MMYVFSVCPLKTALNNIIRHYTDQQQPSGVFVLAPVWLAFHLVYLHSEGCSYYEARIVG